MGIFVPWMVSIAMVRLRDPRRGAACRERVPICRTS